VIIVTPDTDSILPIFFREFLNSEGGRQMVLAESRGQIQQHFNVGSLSNARLMVPPVGLQKKFVERIEDIERLRSSAMRSLGDLDALFSSLQHSAFRGEL